MRENEYLKWMAKRTRTRWCNDSALRNDFMAAREYGAVGCTTDPPLSFEALATETEGYGPQVEEIRAKYSGRERVLEYYRLLVPGIAKEFLSIYERTKGRTGYVRSQVDPINKAAVERVLKAFPEFRKAYEGDGMKNEDFDSFGAVIMPLDGFDKTGWQKMLDL